MYYTLAAHFGNEYWFDDENVVGQRGCDLTRDAKRKLEQHKQLQTPGKIVAELNFGFWVRMLNRPFEDKIWSRGEFKYYVLRSVFPHAPRRMRKLSLIRDRFVAINRLRNRVFHYEPIWDRPDLVQMHDEILEAVGWISPAKRDSIKLLDRFPSVVHQGKGTIEAAVKEYLGVA